MKTKEELVEELQQKAKETARNDKKVKQYLFVMLPLILVLLIFWSIFSLLGIGSVLMIEVSVLVYFLFSFVWWIYPPFGKIPEEKVEKYFKENLAQRISDNEEKLLSVKKKKDSLEEEQKILKEL